MGGPSSSSSSSSQDHDQRAWWYAGLRAVGESTRYVVSATVATTLLVQRDVPTVLWVLGAVLAAVANKGLKRLIDEKRPSREEGLAGPPRKSSGGMPSSHACAMSNLGATALWLTWGGTPTSLAIGAKAALTAGLVAYWLASLTWRVVNRYHTVAQIAVGAAFGASTSVAWRLVCDGSGLAAWATRLAAEGSLDVGLLGATVLLLGALVVGFVEVKQVVRVSRRRPPTAGTTGAEATTTPSSTSASTDSAKRD